MSEGDPGRAAAGALTFAHAKKVLVFDVDIVVEDEDVLRVIELADRRDTRHRLAAAAEISALAREVHPRLVPFRRDHRLVHAAFPVIDRAHLVLDAGRVALRAEGARRLAERTFDH